MILVTLGTQDKSFKRLLEAIESQIQKGNITDKVIVQAGFTKFESRNMELLEYIPINEFDELVKKSDLIITHAGVGSIMAGINNGKKVIAAARLKSFKEHTNNHQLQILKILSSQGYILELENFDKLDEIILKAKDFEPKRFASNTKNVISLIEQYIDKN